jgi:hypothetical protein
VPPLTSQVRRSRLLDFPHQPGIKQRMRHEYRLRERAELRLQSMDADQFALRASVVCLNFAA